MDTRRLLIIAAVGLGLSGCAVFRADGPTPPLRTAPAPALADGFDPQPGPLDPAPAAPMPVEAPSGRPYEADAAPAPAPEPGIADAGPQDARVGGVQVFAWSPGRVYPVRAAPLRVTTLTLGAGETLVSKAAGDTVRWQIGDGPAGDLRPPAGAAGRGDGSGDGRRGARLRRGGSGVATGGGPTAA